MTRARDITLSRVAGEHYERASQILDAFRGEPDEIAMLKAIVAVAAGRMAFRLGGPAARQVLVTIDAALERRSTEPAPTAALSKPAAAVMREVLQRVCDETGYTVEELRAPRRGPRELMHARQWAMALLRETGRFSYPQIGAYLGGRDHTTVLHGVRAHRRRAAMGRFPVIGGRT